MSQKEQLYDFRKKLLTVHQSHVRDFSLSPKESELVISDGATIVVEPDVGDVVLTAARDLVDYLFVSMGVSAFVTNAPPTTGKENTIYLSLKEDIGEASGYSGFEIEAEQSITIYGYDERGIAQGIYYLEDLFSIRRAPFAEKGVTRRRPLFSPRMVHSGFGLDLYPNEHLSAIAHQGIDAILIFVKAPDTTPYGYLDFNDLVYRAAKYGIDVYAYSYLRSHKYPGDSDAQAFYDNLYGTVFEKCPGLKGVVLVGESVEFPSKDKNVSPKSFRENFEDGIPTGKPSPGFWPCEDYPLWLDVVKKAVRKHNKEADIVFWTYNWGWAPEEDRLRLIETLPLDISLLVTYEMFEHFPLGDTVNTCADYTLSFAGPGHYFKTEAAAAKKRGLKLYTMSNTGGLTWDIGVIPYEPFPYQWLRRYEGLLDAHQKWGLSGLMESHHYGIWPSFISEFAKRVFYNDGTPPEEILQDILYRHFHNFSDVAKALKLWSEAITHYTPTDEDQYGAFRIGPATPFCLLQEVVPPASEHAMFGNRIRTTFYMQSNRKGRSLISVRIHEEMKSLEKMLQLIDEGVEVLEGIRDKNDALLNLLNLGKFISCCVITGIHAKKWHIKTSLLKIESDRKKLRILIDEVDEIAKAEIANAENAIPLAEFDSRIGWEPSMEYLGDADHIRWKIKHMNYVLESELATYRECVDI